MMRTEHLKELIERGEYSIDSERVADAILQRLRGQDLVAAIAAAGQSECSYPESARPSSPAYSTPGGPSSTRPTTVRRVRRRAVAVV